MGVVVVSVGYWVVVVGIVNIGCGFLGDWSVVICCGGFWLGITLAVDLVWVGLIWWRGFGCWFLVVWSSVLNFLSLSLNNGWFSRGDGVVGLLGLLVIGLGLWRFIFGLGLGVGLRLGMWGILDMLSTITSGLIPP